MQNYPNPFNPEVWIPYELSEQTEVSIQIYNASGQLVRILDLGMKDRGRYTSMDKAAYWAGLNEAGEKASSGVYFYVLKAGKFTATRKMVLLK
jgi:flagellar hook assembly protein FlgD